MFKRDTTFPTLLTQAALAGFVLTTLVGLSPACAQNAILASGQASLTGFSYELIDLSPDDGETPWIRFGSATEPIGGLVDATGMSHLPTSARQADWQGGILPTDAIQLTSADGYTRAQASADGFSTSFKVLPGTFGHGPLPDGREGIDLFSQVRTGNGIASLAYEVDEATGAVNAVDGDTSWRPVDFTLSANTAIVIHAQASASLDIGPLIQAEWRANGSELTAGSGVQIALMLLNPSFSMKPNYASTDDFYADMDQAYQLTFDGLSADWTPDDLSNMTPASRDLFITLNNEADIETRGSLLMTGMSQMTYTRAVPEPGTWALMGLGLLAVGRASCARKAASRA